MIGQTISHYRIFDKLGEGGMGVVYKAEDTALERPVALKFLAGHLLNDDEAKQRFLREAKSAAGLHHPNICTVHEIDEADGKTFLAMAFLEGETLEDRIAGGPLSLKDALDIGRQAAEGLAAAHAAGVVHRDIKPANILVSPDGRATIMDFGLARLTEASKLTKADQTVGTAAYMSPEQMQGGEVDHRTDVWSLGCVLYEMVAGVRPFPGQYDQALAYEIVNQDPEPLTAVRSGVPMELEFIVGKCLAKEARDRYENAAELAKDLRTLGERLKSGRSPVTHLSRPAAGLSALDAEQALPSGSGRTSPGSQQLLLVLLAAATLALLAVSFVHFAEQPPAAPPVVALSVPLPQGALPGQLSVSPDGRHVAATVPRGGSLWVRSLDSADWKELEGTEDARYPCWSPDSEEIGFFADGKLKAIALAGGPPQIIADARDGRGASWGADGTILFTPAPFGPIFRVAASGGASTRVTEAGEGPVSHRFPHLLPDGRHFLYSGTGASEEDTGVYLGSIDGHLSRRLLPDDSNAICVLGGPQSDSAFVLFLREERLMAQPFDLSALEVLGRPVALPASPPRSGNAGFYGFSASDSGVLAYNAALNQGPLRLVWVGRNGKTVEPTNLVAEDLRHVSLSPDGGKIAYSAEEAGNRDVWIYDLSRQTRIRVSSEPGDDGSPVWSPAGDQVAYRSAREETFGDIYLGPADGSRSATAIASKVAEETPTDWSRDGRIILYHYRDGEVLHDVWYLERQGEGSAWEPKPFLKSPKIQVVPRLSPDGRYVAYLSNESGRFEVYIQPFPQGGRRVAVSTEGGGAPKWSRDGSELFYVAPDQTLVAVEVSTTGELTIGKSTRLFQDSRLTTRNGLLDRYDVSVDGQKFLVVEPAEGKDEDASGPTETIQIVVNWVEKYLANQ